MTKQHFLYRHSKFPPTTQNVFLLGLAAGAALVAIAAVLVSLFP
jgi:hypothetical protein